jgi:3-isopropylmalate/(R)-2-methylmalate dehydratase small subunit
MSEPVTTIRSRTVVLPAENVDTDQIIPARYLLRTGRAGYGEHLFANWRYDEHGKARPEFVLNHPASTGAEILVAGRNFGCGSSREHAVWALRDYGFKAVVSTAFADIFRANALKNGLVPVIVDENTHRNLLAHSGEEVTVDLDARTFTTSGGTSVEWHIEPFARYCLMKGVDELAFLISRGPEIAAFEAKNGPVPWRLSS